MLLVTGEDVLLTMTPSWEVLNEVPAPSAAVKDAPYSAYWRGDGQYIVTRCVAKPTMAHGPRSVA